MKPILATCPPDGLVFDPFLGSGTTLVVAKQLGRAGLGFELNAQHAEFSAKRLAATRTMPKSTTLEAFGG